MTVLTKPISEMKKKSGLSEPLVAAEYPVAVGGGATDSDVVVVPSRKVERLGCSIDERKQRYRDSEDLVIVSRHQSRVNSATTVCLFLVGLLVLSIGIVGGIYLYQQCARKPMQRLRGFLNVPYNSSEGRTPYYHLGDSRSSLEIGIPDVSAKKAGYFSEQFEAGAGYERLDVPEINGGRHGQFIHDLRKNKTGIVDVDGKRCFVIPLDPEGVVFFPLEINIDRKLTKTGTDMKVIVKTMRITFPPLADMSILGAKIAQGCSGMRVYSLVKASLGPGGPVFKRSAEEPVVFQSFSGNTMKVEIVNYQEVVEAEKGSNGIDGA